MLSRLPFALNEVHVVFMVFTYIYVYWCPSRFPYQMMFVLVISNTAGVACRAGYPYLSSPQVFSGVCYQQIDSDTKKYHSHLRQIFEIVLEDDHIIVVAMTLRKV
jgi:hypothetical protein